MLCARIKVNTFKRDAIWSKRYLNASFVTILMAFNAVPKFEKLCINVPNLKQYGLNFENLWKLMKYCTPEMKHNPMREITMLICSNVQLKYLSLFFYLKKRSKFLFLTTKKENPPENPWSPKSKWTPLQLG